MTCETRPKPPMRRRRFIEMSMLTAANFALAASSNSAKKSLEPSSGKMVSITYNVYAFNGYPKTDDTRPVLDAVRRQMPARMAMELAMYQPDIVTFQEAPAEAEVAKVAELLEMRYVYFPGGFPGALLTRLNILESENCPFARRGGRGELFSRHWGKALLDVNGARIMVYSAHLHPSNDAIRALEVEEVLNVIRADTGKVREFILQGDLNHEPIQDEYRHWVSAGLTDCYVKKGVEQRNTIKSTFPNRTVDYIWVNRELSQKLLRCRVLFENGFRTNPMDERSYALSDHLPVMAEFQLPLAR